MGRHCDVIGEGEDITFWGVSFISVQTLPAYTFAINSLGKKNIQDLLLTLVINIMSNTYD